MKTRVLLTSVALVAALFFSAMPTTASANYGGQVHCMKYGETLYGVAHYYGVSAHAIAHHNGIYNPNYVRAGRCLRIPAAYGHGAGYGKHYKPAPPVKKHYKPAPKKHGYTGGGYYGGRYCVGYGDTLWGIAYRHGVSVHALAKANGIYNVNYIRKGQCLTIPRW